MANLTKYDEKEKDIVVLEEERLLNAQGFIDEAEMYKIMRHLAEKLSEYERAEEQGLLIRLPCKAEDIVYRVADRVHTDRIEEFVSDKDGLWYKLTNGKIGRIERFGTSVFTKESEAEEALSKQN